MTTSSAPQDADFGPNTILHHKPGLFVLFFTEMWERFSYYGMRALLVLFLTASLFDEGWGWGRQEALQLYAFYTGLVYLTPIIGGFLADRLFGFRRAVVLGALMMTIGHASMALETVSSFYVGLICLILGNGLFKPNISSMVGQLYDDEPQKRDAAYTIFYMGINAGAFLGILLCGYVGEKVGWSYGFGLAGIFMFLGMVQFYFAQGIFGDIGLSPKNLAASNFAKQQTDPEAYEALQKEAEQVEPHVERDRIIVIFVFSFFTIFFWWAFEQAGGSMTIFAKDYTDRVLEGGQATAFKVINTILTVVPLLVITWVLAMLFKATFSRTALSNLCLGLSFLIIWAIALWLIQNDFRMTSYIVSYEDFNGQAQETKIRTPQSLAAGDTVRLSYSKEIQQYDPDDEANAEHEMVDSIVRNADGDRIGFYVEGALGEFVTEQPKGLFWRENVVAEVPYETLTGTKLSHRLILPSAGDSEEEDAFAVGQTVGLLIRDDIDLAEPVDEPAGGDVIDGQVVRADSSEIEVPASWFGILNSFFIIVCAPLFSRFWEMNIIRSGPIKFALGLILLGIGFAALAFGSLSIPSGAKAAQVSMLWLILAYLFHTLGELCLSPVGLSYVSKLAPLRLVGLMFGIWFVATFIANFAAGLTGSYIDQITEAYSLSVFFFIFTAVPIGAGFVLVLMNGMLKRMMHGVE